MSPIRALKKKGRGGKACEVGEKSARLKIDVVGIHGKGKSTCDQKKDALRRGKSGPGGRKEKKIRGDVTARPTRKRPRPPIKGRQPLANRDRFFRIKEREKLGDGGKKKE